MYYFQFLFNRAFSCIIVGTGKIFGHWWSRILCSPVFSWKY